MMKQHAQSRWLAALSRDTHVPRDVLSEEKDTRERVCAPAAQTAVTSSPHLRWGQMLVALLLVGATFVVYLPALGGGYVWDDDLHLLNNPVLRPGGLAKIWVPGTYINYWPLTFSIYWLEDKLWGIAHPIGFHLVNVLLHSVCALLVWRVLLRVHVQGVDKGPAFDETQRPRLEADWGTTSSGALLGAAIFALHPVNVESVAWVAQLKNVLSLFLTLLVVLFYLRHERTGEWGIYVLAVAVFGLSTLAKGMGVTLAFVLLALAWWQRGKISRRDVWRVAPFLVIGLVMACVEVAMQNEGQPWAVPRTDSQLARLAGAGWCVWFYLYKLFWPLNLSFVYPRWTINSGELRSFVPDALLLGTMFVAWWQRRSWGRGLFMLLFCYVALLLPVLGFANIYFMRYSLVADHWQYAAMIVPAAGVGARLAAWARRGIPQIAVSVGVVVMLGSLGALTYRQAGIYKDVETLWGDVIKRNPDSWMPRHNLGNWLANRGRVEEAVVHYEAVVRLKPDDFQAYNNLGVMLQRLDRPQEAIVNFERALEINADYALARQNLIPEYKRLGKRLLSGERDYEAARRYYIRATQLAPDDTDAHFGLGVALIGTANMSEAVDELQKAVTLSPAFVDAHDTLARILATRAPADGGNPDRAIREALQACVLTAYQDGLRLDALAIAYASAGRFDEAVATQKKALQLVQGPWSQDLVSVLQAHLNLFRAGRPYRGPVLPLQ